MPFPFVLGTTSHVTYQTNFTSTTHPSLPAAATAQRNILRAVLKQHKRTVSQSQNPDLSTLLSALTEYLRYLHSIDTALSGQPVSGEDVDLALTKEIEVQWRPTLTSPTVPGKEPERVKGRGLDYEFYFVHHTYAALQILQARSSLHGLYVSPVPTPEQRLARIQDATRYLKLAYSMHAYLVARANLADGPPTFPPQATDIAIHVQSALQRLTSAEFNLLCVLKDDPYPAVLVQSRDKDDREWMIKAPDIPKVRTQVLTRLCIGAADHATAAIALLHTEGKRVSKDLIEYVEDLRRTARARACRFQALDNDMSGQTGKAIAWLHAGLNELGLEAAKEGNYNNSKSSDGGGGGGGGGSGLSKLKSAWHERREDRRLTKGVSTRWGSDGGKLEETRILAFLQRKFTKANDTINVQIVPDWRPLPPALPSGMNMPLDDHGQRWRPSLLSEDALTPMRAPPDPDDARARARAESSDEDVDAVADALDRTLGSKPVGAFPGTADEYSGTSYY